MLKRLGESPFWWSRASQDGVSDRAGYDMMLDLTQNTTTRKGLKIEAFLNGKSYGTGAKISTIQMKEININTRENLPQWNYTIRP